MAEVINCQQGTQEWYQARAGIVTASQMHHLLYFPQLEAYQHGAYYADAKWPLDWLEQHLPEVTRLKTGVLAGEPKKTRIRCDHSDLLISDSYFGDSAIGYMYKLIGERITGRPMENFSSKHTERGHNHEPFARELYEIQTGNTTHLCGLMKAHDVGFSPDLLIGHAGTGEIKSKLPHIHLDIMYKGEVPDEHIAQIQTGLWVSEREWCDFISYCPFLPLFVKRVERDEQLIEVIQYRVIEFYSELDRRMKRIIKNAMGYAA